MVTIWKQQKQQISVCTWETLFEVNSGISYIFIPPVLDPPVKSMLMGNSYTSGWDLSTLHPNLLLFLICFYLFFFYMLLFFCGSIAKMHRQKGKRKKWKNGSSEHYDDVLMQWIKSVSKHRLVPVTENEQSDTNPWKESLLTLAGEKPWWYKAH